MDYDKKFFARRDYNVEDEEDNLCLSTVKTNDSNDEFIYQEQARVELHTLLAKYSAKRKKPRLQVKTFRRLLGRWFSRWLSALSPSELCHLETHLAKWAASCAGDYQQQTARKLEAQIRQLWQSYPEQLYQILDYHASMTAEVNHD